MFVLTLKWNKKTAVLLVAAVAVLLAVIVLIAALGGSDAPKDTACDMNTCEGRVAYLSQLGWEVDAGSETEQDIVIPREFSPVYTKYNELQISQGFDLSDYCGMDAKLYTYDVVNYPDGVQALAQMIVCSGQLIGGDIHSTALNGFMHGLRPMPD